MKIYYRGDSLSKRIGVYKILFYTIYGIYVYIGKTYQSFSSRWSNHRYSFRHNTCNRFIKNLINNEQTTIVFEVMRDCDTKEECAYWESYYIKKYQPELNIYLK